MHRGGFERTALLALAALALLACGKKDNAGGGGESEPAAPVQVEAARRGPIDHIIVVDAVLYPVNQSNVMAKISAPVERVMVNRGDHVRAGQVIAQLENRDLAAGVGESRGQLEQAQAAYKTTTGATVFEDRTKAKDDVEAAAQALEASRRLYENRVALQKEGALAQKLVDDAKVAMVQAQSTYETAERHLEALNQVSQREQIAAAKAQMETAAAHLRSSEAQLSYTRIVSPIAGVVAERPVYPGEIAGAGAPVASIVDVSQVIARANIPVKDATAIRVGRPATIASGEATIGGKVTVVSPAVDPSTTTVEVWVQAVNTGERLKPGSAVRISIKAETLQNAILVPASALLSSPEGGGDMVMVVGPDSLAHQRKIVVGVRQGDTVQIASGVNEGEQVITQGGLGLDDNAKVVVQKPGAESDEDAAAPAADEKDDRKDDKKDGKDKK
jgi:multidrug efflux pump subunit AcrA (membrane-fusion protein)